MRAVLFAAVYLALLGVFAIGIATIVRRTAGAIATMVGLLLVAPIIVNLLLSPWNDNIGKFLPSEAGTSMFQALSDRASLRPVAGFGVVAIYTAVALTAGVLLLRSRDVELIRSGHRKVTP